jgi:hypothetical protein
MAAKPLSKQQANTQSNATEMPSKCLQDAIKMPSKWQQNACKMPAKNDSKKNAKCRKIVL